MKVTYFVKLCAVAVLSPLFGCDAGDGSIPLAVEADRLVSEGFSWSEAVNLGPPVNSPVQEQNPTLSKSELSLYFVSNRTDLPGAQGGNDIWVSRRACLECPWETPVNLGPVINTASGDAGPNLSADGHLLFFTSNRIDELGTSDNDIYVSYRADTKDDLGWSVPVKVGPEVNSALSEFGPHFMHDGDGETATFYFQRGQAGGSPSNDIFAASVTRAGQVLGSALPVSELNDPTFADGSPSVRKDGREIFFNSTRVGRIGSVDIWASTRGNATDAWSTPVNLGTPVNIGGIAGVGSRDPDLSFDGRTLVFMSNRPGSIPRSDGVPSDDIWISTRASGGY